MKILILGSGMMGPAAAFSALANPEVSQVIVCDASEAQRQACIAELAKYDIKFNFSEALTE